MLGGLFCCCGGKTDAGGGPLYLTVDHQRRAQAVQVSGNCVSGEGSALGSAAVLQDRAFWEAKVVTLGYFALGVANHSVKLTETKLGASSSPKSWGIDSDTLLEQYELNAGDTVGVAFDQSDEKVLRIYHNGQYLSGQDVRGMRGETWPIIIVAGGAKLELNFGTAEFEHPIPRMFDGVMAPRSLV